MRVPGLTSWSYAPPALHIRLLGLGLGWRTNMVSQCLETEVPTKAEEREVVPVGALGPQLVDRRHDEQGGRQVDDRVRDRPQVGVRSGASVVADATQLRIISAVRLCPRTMDGVHAIVESWNDSMKAESGLGRARMMQEWSRRRRDE